MIRDVRSVDSRHHYFHGQRMARSSYHRVTTAESPCPPTESTLRIRTVLLEHRPTHGVHMSDEKEIRTGRRTFMKATGALGAGAGIALTAGTPAAGETASEHGTNSFDNALSPIILNAGFTASWNYTFGGSDRGVQFAGPNILPPQTGGKHTIVDQGKSINAGSVTYFVTIRNDGGTQSVHNLEGGGLS